MGALRATVRVTLASLMVSAGALVIVVSGLLPWRVRGVRPAGWLACGLAWLVCRILAVRIECATPERLRRHRGLFFPNHLTFLDPLVLLSLTPARFLAALEVAKVPAVGWITRSIDTIYVARKSRESRQAVRQAVADAFHRAPQPPIVLFPEGRLGPGNALYPFRYGAFAIAIEHHIPLMPVGLRYQPAEIAAWRGGQGESLWTALWRIASFRGPLRVEVLPLPVVVPTQDLDPVALTQQIQDALAQALGFPVELNPPSPRLVH